MAKQASVGHKEILSDLKSKNYKPVYFLSGEEPYFIDLIADYIEENVLDESEKSFNQYVYYGKDSNIKTILENARRFPMMADHQVIIVKEAQNLERGGDDGGSFDMLVGYLQNPQPSTILVFCYKKKADKRKKYVSEVSSKGVFFSSERLYDSNLPSFILEYVRERKIQIEQNAVQLLADHIGNDLHRLVNELEKLVMTKPAGTDRLTVDLVEKNVGISKEFNDFELKSAILRKDIYKVNFIAFHMSQMKTFSLNLSISVLYAYFANLMVYHYMQNKNAGNVAAELQVNPYFVNEYVTGAKNYNAVKTMQVISVLREYDAKAKGVGNSSPQGELLKEMIYKILH